MPPERWPYPRLIAHRGAGSLAPENTLAAIRTGHAHGFKAVEFDVALSADSVAVLMHDETVDRTTDGHGPLDHIDASALARLDAGSWHSAAFKGEPVPTFKAAAALCVEFGLWANVEIKPVPGHEADTGRIAALLSREVWRGAPLAPLLSSFQPQALSAARESVPELPRALLFDAVPPDWRAQLASLGCVALHCNGSTLQADTAAEIIATGYGLAVWTVNDLNEAARLFALGVDAIFTDRLDLFAGFQPKPSIGPP
jgi:glycerophosphoryl diester phosphodiesterase